MATTKARHGTITPMNQTHTAPSCTLADFYAGDWVDRLDEAKTMINERDKLASGGAMAPGRKVDDQITTVLDPTRSEEHTSELQSLMSSSYDVFCMKKNQQRTSPQSSASKQ